MSWVELKMPKWKHFAPLNINRTFLRPHHHHRGWKATKIPFRLDENNWKLILTKPSSRWIFHQALPCMSRVCERTSRSSWQSLAAVEAPEPKQPLFTSHFFYVLRLRLSAFVSHAGRRIYLRWENGKKGTSGKKKKSAPHTYRFSPDFRLLYTLPVPQKARSSTTAWSMGPMLTLNGENEKTTKCVRAWVDEITFSNFNVAKSLSLCEWWVLPKIFVDPQRMPIEIKKKSWTWSYYRRRRRCVSIVVVVGNSQQKHEKMSLGLRWKKKQRLW